MAARSLYWFAGLVGVVLAGAFIVGCAAGRQF